jgi:hypothetical protein
MNKFIAILTPVTFIVLLAGWANAADSKTTVRHLKDGSTEVCKYETDFATAKDGGLVIRTAWRCVTTKGK